MRVQNADGSVEVQPDEEPWDGTGSATSSTDVSALALLSLASGSSLQALNSAALHARQKATRLAPEPAQSSCSISAVQILHPEATHQRCSGI